MQQPKADKISYFEVPNLSLISAIDFAAEHVA
jgi:hypothetical protein